LEEYFKPPREKIPIFGPAGTKSEVFAYLFHLFWFFSKNSRWFSLKLIRFFGKMWETNQFINFWGSK